MLIYNSILLIDRVLFYIQKYPKETKNFIVNTFD